MQLKYIAAAAAICTAIAGCTTSTNVNLDAEPLVVKVTHTGPEIDPPHMRVNRLTNSTTTNVGKTTRTLTLGAPAPGVACSSPENCRQFLQDSKFFVTALNDETAKVSWEIHTGRRVTTTLQIGLTKTEETREIPSSVPSVPDAKDFLEVVVKAGETKTIRGPYGSVLTIDVAKKN